MMTFDVKMYIPNWKFMFSWKGYAIIVHDNTREIYSTLERFYERLIELEQEGVEVPRDLFNTLEKNIKHW